MRPYANQRGSFEFGIAPDLGTDAVCGYANEFIMLQVLCYGDLCAWSAFEASVFVTDSKDI